MQITKQIGRKKYLSGILFGLSKLFFFLSRKIAGSFVNRDGNIVIISLLRLGDTVFTIPAVKELRKYYKKKIIVVCFPESVSIYKQALYDVDFCEMQREYFIFGKRIARHKARKLLSRLRPEIIFDFTGVMTSATLIFNARAKEIIGIGREQFKPVYDRFVEIRKQPHLIDVYLDIVETVVSGIDREEIRNFPAEIKPGGRILIHPFAGWSAKEWGIRKFLILAQTLNEEYEISITAPAGSVPDDIRREIENKNISFNETKGINDLIENIKQCSVFIGNDTGPLYIANLFGKPTFTIYGPTNPDFHMPFGNYHGYCRISLKCSPGLNEKVCFTDGGLNGCPAFECMNRLTTDSVLQEIKSFLKKLNIEKVPLR